MRKEIIKSNSKIRKLHSRLTLQAPKICPGAVGCNQESTSNFGKKSSTLYQTKFSISARSQFPWKKVFRSDEKNILFEDLFKKKLKITNSSNSFFLTNHSDISH